MNMVRGNNRNYNIDLLRIMACFMVIVIHVSAYNWYTSSVTSFNWMVYNIYDSIVRSAVPIFVMISGIFFLSNDKYGNIKSLYLKNILKLVILFFSWSLIYLLYNIVTDPSITLNFNYIFTELINGPFHFWYIPVIIGLYVISPVLKKIVASIDRNLFKYFLALFITASILRTISYMEFIPYINYINLLINKLPIDIILQFYSYFMLGYFLYHFDISSNKKKIIYILSLVSIIFCAILTYFSSLYLKKPNVAFYGNFSIFTLIESMAVFLFFKDYNFKSRKIYSKQIYKISQCTLGIYIIHMLVMNSLFKFNLINITSFNTILSVPIISILVFFISLVISYYLKKIKLFSKYLL